MLMMLLTVLAAQAATIRASTTHKDADATYSATRAVDGSFQTSWAEATPGTTAGEWLELDLGRSMQIDNVAIWPGNLTKGSRSFREYSRPRTIQVVIDGVPTGGTVILEDKMHRRVIKVGARGRKVRIAIEDAHEGIVFTDTHIAEMAINFPTGPLERYDRWLQTSDAKRRHAQFITRLEEAYAKQKGEEFGDKDALQYMMDAVASGPPYASAKVASLVGLGFRAQAAPSSAKAMKALRLLKDANAIPAFEMAALRSTGELEQEAMQTAEILRAHQDMIGNQHNNIPFWGETGWNLGAFRSFGEPLGMAMDAEGNMYIADIGNNRVQRFTIEGRATKQWGPGADLADTWFDKGRAWYASGAKPGTGIGEFENPLDVALIPGKEGVGFAVLDTANRIQVFDHEGRAIRSWTLSATKRARPGLGGEGHLVYLPKAKALMAIVQNQARTHNLNGEELGAFSIEDGVPRAVEADPKGHVLLGYRDQVVRYHTEGYRFGTIITSDQIGVGHEDIAMTFDENKKLWIVTDNGMVTKFKKPGVVDFAVGAIDRPLKGPRIAVKEGMLFVLSDDRIEQVDVLQAVLDAAGPTDG
jgi:hypothetical protein